MSTILLIEDSPTDRALIRTILTRGGFEVHELAYGLQAVDRVRVLRPLAIVLDLNLPDSDGLTICRQLKAEPLLANTPVLMLTIRHDEADVLAGLEAGADDYVSKDSAEEIILARVRRLVHDRQMTLAAALNQQLAQVGRLLAGIVHEIRTPLAVIRGNADMMRMKLADDDKLLYHLDPILRNAQIMQVRLEHLMATVRGVAKSRPTEVPPVVREAADLFLKSRDPRQDKLVIHSDFAPDLPFVNADPGRLLQVLMNLLGNAHDAIRSHCQEGLIEVTAATVEADERPWVVVEVIDNGPGIPDAFLTRIFEPFFTTKESGSGYGLYLANEILKEHGGRLTASNRPGLGACFSIWLPLAEQETPAGTS